MYFRILLYVFYIVKKCNLNNTVCNSVDNLGSDHASLCKTGNTFLPCRNCEIKREEMMLSDISMVPIRDSERYNTILCEAFNAYCCYVLAERPKDVPQNYKEILKFCESHSLQPMLPTFNKLAPSYEGHSSYRRFPPDLMHTVYGLLEFWISMIVTILLKVGKTYPAYRHNISSLDKLLNSFPYKQSMPFKVKNFTKGLSTYIPGLHSREDSKTTGYGKGLKMIDYKDEPSLMLQILLCKSPICNTHKLIVCKIKYVHIEFKIYIYPLQKSMNFYYRYWKQRNNYAIRHS